MKQKRTEIARIIANCDEAIKDMDAAEVKTVPVAPAPEVPAVAEAPAPEVPAVAVPVAEAPVAPKKVKKSKKTSASA